MMAALEGNAPAADPGSRAQPTIQEHRLNRKSTV